MKFEIFKLEVLNLRVQVSMFSSLKLEIFKFDEFGLIKVGNLSDGYCFNWFHD